jgi:hypothetical protein
MACRGTALLYLSKIIEGFPLPHYSAKNIIFKQYKFSSLNNPSSNSVSSYQIPVFLSYEQTIILHLLIILSLWPAALSNSIPHTNDIPWGNVGLDRDEDWLIFHPRSQLQWEQRRGDTTFRRYSVCHAKNYHLQIRAVNLAAKIGISFTCKGENKPFEPGGTGDLRVSIFNS